MTAPSVMFNAFFLLRASLSVYLDMYLIGCCCDGIANVPSLYGHCARYLGEIQHP